MENAHTDKLNSWSSFSQTTMVTILIGTLLFSLYFFLDQASARIVTAETTVPVTPTLASAQPSNILPFLQATFFVGLIPGMYLLRYHIRNSKGFDRRRFQFFSTQNPSFSVFLGLLAGGFLLFCVQFTIRSMFFIS